MLKIEKVRGTYYEITLDGRPVTGETFTYAQALTRMKVYDMIYGKAYGDGYSVGHHDALEWVEGHSK